MSANKDAALALLRKAAARIDSSMLAATEAGADLSLAGRQQMLRAIDSHGEDGVVAVKVMPSWKEGQTPLEFGTGYRMIFDAAKARVVPSIIDTNSLYAGTMAFQVPASAIAAAGENAKLSEDGLTVHASEIVSALNEAVKLKATAGVADSYVGVFEHKNRGDSNYTHNYWVVARGVNPQLNKKLEEEIYKHDGKTYEQLMNATKKLRDEAFHAQRMYRAEQISAALSAVGITVSAAEIKRLAGTSPSVVDSVFNSLDDGDGNTAILRNDAIAIKDKTLDMGIVLTESLRLGPVLLVGDANKRSGTVDVFPSTTGFVLHTHAQALFDAKSKMSANSVFTWENAAGSAQNHPLLAKNAYRSRTSPAWKRFEAEAGVIPARTLELTPVAIKLIEPTTF